MTAYIIQGEAMRYHKKKNDFQFRPTWTVKQYYFLTLFDKLKFFFSIIQQRNYIYNRRYLFHFSVT